MTYIYRKRKCLTVFLLLTMLSGYITAGFRASAATAQTDDTAKQYSNFSNIPKYGEDRLVHSGFTKSGSGMLQFSPADNHTPLILQLDANFADFERLYIDGELISASGYTVAAYDRTFEIPCERFYEVFSKHGTRGNPLTVHRLTFAFGGGSVTDEIIELYFQSALPRPKSNNALRFAPPVLAVVVIGTTGLVVYRRHRVKKS